MTTTSAAGPESPDAPTAWSPLRIVAFRALWLAQLASMIGTWMQTVGAQWLLIDEPDAATLVSLVQTASLLPMLLLALPFAARSLSPTERPGFSPTPSIVDGSWSVCSWAPSSWAGSLPR